MKHTKGNWRIRFMNSDGSGVDDGECDFFIEAKEPKSQIGKIEILMEDFGEHSGYPREQKLADAKIIAAVPDLLSACQMAREELVFGGDWENAKRIIDLAISKAL